MADETDLQIVREPAKLPVAPTDYEILARTDLGVWKQTGSVSARSADAAIRSIGKEGTYVAIPARSFKPVTVKAEVVTTLKLEDAQ